MANIQAFRALRYDLSRVGKLSSVVAPPYDVIDAALQNELYARSDYNVVRIDLNRPEPGDGPEDGYHRAGIAFKAWKREGILQLDPQPAIYVYHQLFTDSEQTFTRRGFVCRLGLERFGEGKVYPHEETHSGAKRDRLLLTQQTKANLSCIFGLYEDAKNAVQDLLEQAIGDRTPLEALDDAGVIHRIWLVTDLATISAVAERMGDRAIFIADGHHRYETSCNYRDEVAAQRGGNLPTDHPANYTMMACFGMSDPGLVVLPTHRLFRGVAPRSAADLAASLGSAFDCSVIAQGPDAAPAIWNQLDAAGEQSWLAFYTRQDARWTLAKLTAAGQTQLNSISDHSADWNSLGVSILHRLVMDQLLGLSNLPSPLYVRKIEEVVQGLVNGDSAGRDATGQAGSGQPFELAALVLPATVDHVRQISLNRERMPAKSTYFYPKLLTGLVFNPLD